MILMYKHKLSKLVVADKKVSPRENLYLKELYNAWEDETEE